MATATENSAQPRFLLTPELMAGAIYRKYEKATRKFWDPKELDYERDRADWEHMTDAQREGLITITVRIEAGEQAVTDELLPMLAAAHELGRFDWVMFLSTFMQEEARHSEFFNIWHRDVCGVTTPAEKAAYWPLREHTMTRPVASAPASPSTRASRSTARRSWPPCGRRPGAIEEGFIRFSTIYNVWIEGVLTMPTYEIVLDTCTAWDVLATLLAGFRGILADEGRHITFGTEACRILIAEHPEYEALVHEIVDEYCGNAVACSSTSGRYPGSTCRSTRRRRCATTETAAARWASSRTRG